MAGCGEEVNGLPEFVLSAPPRGRPDTNYGKSWQ